MDAGIDEQAIAGTADFAIRTDLPVERNDPALATRKRILARLDEREVRAVCEALQVAARHTPRE